MGVGSRLRPRQDECVLCTITEYPRRLLTTSCSDSQSNGIYPVCTGVLHSYQLVDQLYDGVEAVDAQYEPMPPLPPRTWATTSVKARTVPIPAHQPRPDTHTIQVMTSSPSRPFVRSQTLSHTVSGAHRTRRLLSLILVPVLTVIAMLAVTGHCSLSLWTSRLAIPSLYNTDPHLHTIVDSKMPLLLVQYLNDSLSWGRYHSDFFNEPYMRDRNVAANDNTILASNRAIPHSFYAPLPIARTIYGRALVLGVFCYDVARIEVILDTWAKYSTSVYIFSEPQSDPVLDAYQRSLPNVIVLDNRANSHRNVTDRRASAWKVLPALKFFATLAQSASYPQHWYYLCDDDSFPVIPQLVEFTDNFYDRHLKYPRGTKLYIGQSVVRKGSFKPYYADDPALTLTEDFRYHCTGGGVIVNRPLLQSLTVAGIDSHCPLTFASDLTLGYCIQMLMKADPLFAMTDMPDTHTLWARTIDEVSKYTNYASEQGVWEAGAFHHMREPFIGNAGIDTRLEVYLRESEMRTYSHYLHRLHQYNARYGDSSSDMPVRLLIVSECGAISRNSSTPLVDFLLSEFVSNTGYARLGLFADIGILTDVQCTRATVAETGWIPSIQQQLRNSSNHFYVIQPLVDRLQYSLYDAVLDLSSDAVTAAEEPASTVIATQQQLIDCLFLLDAYPPAGIVMPSVVLYYGIFHSLLPSSMITPITGARGGTLAITNTDIDIKQFLSMPSMSLALSEDTPVLKAIMRYSLAKLCVFVLPAEYQPRLVILHVLMSIASGCLAVVSRETSRLKLPDDNASNSQPLAVLLSSLTTYESKDALESTVQRLLIGRSYAAEVGYQRFALNAHLFEKPLHSLLTTIANKQRAAKPATVGG